MKHTYPFKKYTKNTLIKASFTTDEFTTPQQLRWMPFTLSDTKQSIDFVDGLITICGAGSAFSRTGFATHIYLINQSMKDRALVNADGDFLFGKFVNCEINDVKCLNKVNLQSRRSLEFLK